ncbi:MAG: phosphatidylserine decarboxylase family protein [Flavobacteriaceae bacterium]|nr:phosphatidylserine decarboxylase family protein [Flavobacteriaceae bacterium]|tara:strand:+ start:19127 stop:19780 length:654 start_codon:yes stop_codon:yes gene_type:complete
MFHKEGFLIISLSFIILVGIGVSAEYFISNILIQKSFQIFCFFLLILILQFFRNPKRDIVPNNRKIYSPVDGKIVEIKSVFENEYFKDNRRLVSIFMSPINVHVTRYPSSGVIKYSRYHPGKYLVAWHPKSSEKNERTTVVINTPKFGEILYRQIAGAVARRIVNYAKKGENVVQGEDAGFIKFGSRVDLFLPLNIPINVELNESVVGAKTIIAGEL